MNRHRRAATIIAHAKAQPAPAPLLGDGWVRLNGGRAARYFLPSADSASRLAAMRTAKARAI